MAMAKTETGLWSGMKGGFCIWSIRETVSDCEELFAQLEKNMLFLGVQYIYILYSILICKKNYN